MKQVYFVMGLILGLAIAVFALQNTTPVEVRFLTWQMAGSLALVVLISAGAGLLVALLFGVPEILAARWRLRTLERRLEASSPASGGGGSAKRQAGIDASSGGGRERP